MSLVQAMAAPAIFLAVWWRIATSAELTRRWNAAVHLLGLSGGILAAVLLACLAVMLQAKSKYGVYISATGLTIYIAGIWRSTVLAKRGVRTYTAPILRRFRWRRVQRERTLRQLLGSRKPIASKNLSQTSNHFSLLPRSIQFQYRNSESQILIRRVDVYFANSNRFHGYCYLRKELRTFRFERILSDITDAGSGDTISAHDWQAVLTAQMKNNGE